MAQATPETDPMLPTVVRSRPRDGKGPAIRSAVSRHGAAESAVWIAVCEVPLDETEGPASAEQVEVG
ncbi:MAG: hypothetical protein U0794_21195 [Isosphaeraceae bacterium]